MKALSIVSLVFLLYACHLNKPATRLYGKCAKRYWACTQLLINDDHTFEYLVFMDAGVNTLIKGSWKEAQGDTIVLNSYEQPEVVKSYYSGKTDPNADSIKVTISDFQNPLGFAAVVINNGEQSKVADEKGICYFRPGIINTITWYYQRQSVAEVISIDSQKYSEITIIARDMGSSAYLTNQLVVVRKNEAVLSPKDTIRTYSLKRTKLKNRATPLVLP